MRIAFFGSSLVSSYWNGAATYYRGLLKALADQGVAVTFYEPDAFERQQHRDMSDPRWARVVVYPATRDGWQASLDDALDDADIVVKASGIGVFDAELECAIPQLARPRLLTIYWDVDAPATLESMSADPHHHLREMIPQYDLVLTYGGGDPVIQGYAEFGARVCVPIYNALDPKTHHPVVSRADFSCALGFLGNRLPDRERRVEEFFLKPASLLPERDFMLGGAGWETKEMPANVKALGHVGSRDHNAFFCSSLATLNINRDSMARFGFSPPTRIFEAAGAGACIISDAWQGIEQFLDPGAEIITARSGTEVAEALDRLHPERARRIGRAAHVRVLAQHTYRHRARQVLSILGHTFSKREAAE